MYTEQLMNHISRYIEKISELQLHANLKSKGSDNGLFITILFYLMEIGASFNGI